MKLWTCRSAKASPLAEGMLECSAVGDRICSMVLCWQYLKTFAELSKIRFCAKRDFPIAPGAEAAGALFGEVERSWA